MINLIPQSFANTLAPAAVAPVQAAPQPAQAGPYSRAEWDNKQWMLRYKEMKRYKRVSRSIVYVVYYVSIFHDPSYI